MSAWLLVGVLTWYAGPPGNPLRCSEPGARWRYAEDTPAWIALSAEEFESGRARCGDRLVVKLEGAEPFQALALDSGLLYDHHIAELGPEVRIVGDVPAHLWPLKGRRSARGSVVNLSAMARRRLGMRIGR